jgi:hypothetical protein
LKLEYDKLVSSFAFKFNLRHYNALGDGGARTIMMGRAWQKMRQDVLQRICQPLFLELNAARLMF